MIPTLHSALLSPIPPGPTMATIQQWVGRRYLVEGKGFDKYAHKGSHKN